MKYVNLYGLGKLAKQIREQAGLSQAEAAAQIGSTQSNVSAAEGAKDTRYLSVALSIIEKIGGQKLEGPFYAIHEEPAPYQTDEDCS